MPVVALTPINRQMFLSELKCLSFSTDGDSADFAVFTDGREVFSSTYWPDESGVFSVYGIDRIVAFELSDAAKDFRFMVNGTTVGHPVVTVIRCDVDVEIPASQFVLSRFLTPVAAERDTSIDRYQPLSLFCPETEVLRVRRTFLTSGFSTVSDETCLQEVSGLLTFNASASQFIDESKGRLIGYSLICGLRKADFRVLSSMPQADPAVIFRNCFGCWETFYLSGTKESVPKYTRSTVVSAGKFTLYDVQEESFFKVFSGAMRHGSEPLAFDLARSSAVFLLAPDGGAGDGIVMTDCDLKSTNLDNDIPDFSFTFRRDSAYSSLLEAKAPFRIFDKTFDFTYE